MKLLRGTYEYVEVASIGMEDFREVATRDERDVLSMILTFDLVETLAKRWAIKHDWRIWHFAGASRWIVLRPKSRA